MQIPPANLTSMASGSVGATANAQKMQATSAPAEATAATTRDVAELSQGNADRDAQGQGDGLPSHRDHPKRKEADTKSDSPDGNSSYSLGPREAEGLDLWG